MRGEDNRTSCISLSLYSLPYRFDIFLNKANMKDVSYISLYTMGFFSEEQLLTAGILTMASEHPETLCVLELTCHFNFICLNEAP
ncbi:hypothetical protein H8356DRAFT_1433679 [Neocallimastix lanati (nom. inval.)]|nr:hypothetical protein H8356DRAFT_1433679 [Neocallimastix sp. JGI-2020a]